MISEYEKLVYFEKKKWCYFPVLIMFSSVVRISHWQAWIRRRKRNALTGRDCVFFSVLGAYVTFVFIYLVQSDRLSQINVDTDNKLPVSRDVKRTVQRHSELTDLSILARILQRPSTVRDERRTRFRGLQLSLPLFRTTTKANERF